MDPILRQLHDENEIRKLVVSFALGMDTRDLAMVRAPWADEIALDLPPFAGPAVPLSGTRRADDYAGDVVALLSEFEATQHVSTNHLVTVVDDAATCTCYTVAQHWLHVESAEPWMLAGARYDLVAARLGDAGWRFTGFALTPLWSLGNRAIWDEVARRLERTRAGG
ncbi:MAG: nuclear transport factor 2 family protein [Acidimicrobiia bacterium]